MLMLPAYCPNQLEYFDLNMRNHRNENRIRQLKRNMFDITTSETDSSKRQRFNQLVDGHKFGDREIDSDYGWLLGFYTDTNEQIVSSLEGAITVYEKEDIDDTDPQYSMFLRDLTDNGKSYKLKISENNEPVLFLEYEELEKSDGNVSTGDSGDKVKSSEDIRDKETNLRLKRRLDGRKGEVSLSHAKEISMKKKIKERKRKSSGDMRDRDRDSDRRVKRRLHGRRKGETSTAKEMSKKKKIKERKSLTNSCYHKLLEVKYEGKQVKYEEKPLSSDSDVILIWDSLQGCSEVNDKQPMTAEKDISLKEKLMRILRRPYDRKEHKKLSEYVEKQKPIRRLLSLRGRAVSSEFDGPTKSVLDNVSTSFRKKLEAARNERPRALNLLRMFRFWLEHVPNEDIFQPWLDEECLKVLPSTRR